MKKAIVAVILAAVTVMSGCSLLPGGGSSSGGFLSGGKEHSDKYGSAEEYCEYWFGPCEEVDSYSEEYGDSERTVHVMKDKEFGFEYTVSESKEGYFLFSGNFAYYYIDEFLRVKTSLISLKSMLLSSKTSGVKGIPAVRRSGSIANANFQQKKTGKS